MSLILEALRKSEAERRRGQVPDLHAEPSPGARPLRDRPPVRLWLTLALAAATVLALALWMTRSTPAVNAPVAATGADRSELLGSDGDVGPGDESIGSVGSSGTRDDSAGTGATPASTRQTGRPSSTAPQPAAPSAAAPATPPAPAPAPAEAVDPAALPTAPAPAPVRPPPTAAVAAAAAPGPAPAAAVSTSPVAPPAASDPTPLRLSDLSVAQREQLPPLKMSMHMYSPTQRFAIIDGTRVAAGDRIGGAVVEDITADGVVLDWQGQRLQIPIR